MPIEFLKVIAGKSRGNGGTFSVQSIDLAQWGERASPVEVLDQFRVRSRPFPPHPHAGFSAVTYVLEDSQGKLRSRDSLGNDVVVGPGGIVWTQAGSGVIHEEVPAEMDRELHAVQIFVNLSSKNKLTKPQMLRLTQSEVPEWLSKTGDRVRVVVGSFGGLVSPLVPVEPFDLLDVQLRREISIDLQDGHNAIVYVLKGAIIVQADGRTQDLIRDHALALHGAGQVKFQATEPAHFLVLSGTEIREPVLAQGPFIMNKPSQVEAALARYQAGQMGHLAPLAES